MPATSSGGEAAGVEAAPAEGTKGRMLEVPAGVVVRPGTEPLWAALKEVLDPEFPISVVDLGLIYDIRREGGRVDIDLTFTATGCPCMELIEEDVRDRLAEVTGVEEVAVHIVWDPPWTRDRMTETAREVLRSFGVAA